MDSPLDPLPNIFMVELETSVIPNFNKKIKLWKRFVDDIYNIYLTLNSFSRHFKSKKTGCIGKRHALICISLVFFFTQKLKMGNFKNVSTKSSYKLLN